MYWSAIEANKDIIKYIPSERMQRGPVQDEDQMEERKAIQKTALSSHFMGMLSTYVIYKADLPVHEL